MPDIAIKIQNLTKSYKLYNRHIERLKESLHPLGKKYHRPFYALKDVSFEVPRGEIMGIVGRNGAGKSTLLNIIAGVSTPSSGQVNVKGTVSALLELGTGFNPEMTGIENIYFHGTIKGYSRTEVDSKLDDIIAFADIGEFINQPLKTYSSGMRARLGFAVAINIDPEILIIDEVLAVGDELFKRKCYAKMEELFQSGCTVLFVSHSGNTINEICARAIFLDRGELILDGPAKLVTAYYQKYLFANPDNILKIRDEIIQLDKDEVLKEKFARNLEAKAPRSRPEKQQVLKEDKEEVSRQKALLIPDFKPRSTVVTKNYDVEVYDIHIKTLHGEKVNYLVSNEEYALTFRAKFNLNCDEIVFGFRVKTIKGFRLLTSRLNPGNDSIRNIKIHDEFLTECRFHCNLLEGTYLIDLRITRYDTDEEEPVVNVSDALIFKVQKMNYDYRQAGIIYMDQKAHLKKVNEVGHVG